ncbi:helix-turn-helix domain-containing protein [Bacillus sp. JJ1562]|uniref:helix-turn-helix domain-containing protein n=1 Tax=Bacillus sp. JJ1562 TaxID=3122960 RepID=UPI003001836B
MFEMVGQRVRKYRMERNLTQQELAKRVNITENYVGEIERAKTKASLEVLERICQALEISLEQLFTNYEIVNLVKRQQILLSFVDMLEDQPIEVQKELLKINKALIESIDHLRSQR